MTFDPSRAIEVLREQLFADAVDALEVTALLEAAARRDDASAALDYGASLILQRAEQAPERADLWGLVPLAWRLAPAARDQLAPGDWAAPLRLEALDAPLLALDGASQAVRRGDATPHTLLRLWARALSAPPAPVSDEALDSVMVAFAVALSWVFVRPDAHTLAKDACALLRGAARWNTAQVCATWGGGAVTQRPLADALGRRYRALTVPSGDAGDGTSRYGHTYARGGDGPGPAAPRVLEELRYLWDPFLRSALRLRDVRYGELESHAALMCGAMAAWEAENTRVDAYRDMHDWDAREREHSSDDPFAAWWPRAWYAQVCDRLRSEVEAIAERTYGVSWEDVVGPGHPTRVHWDEHGVAVAVLLANTSCLDAMGERRLAKRVGEFGRKCCARHQAPATAARTEEDDLNMRYWGWARSLS